MSENPRAQRIKELIPIEQVLSDYGYAVHSDLGEREQQFSCDLHGDGSDNRPSARVYPETSSWYCFACSKARDAIATAQEKEQFAMELRDQYAAEFPNFDIDMPEKTTGTNKGVRDTVVLNTNALEDGVSTYIQAVKRLRS